MANYRSPKTYQFAVDAEYFAAVCQYSWLPGPAGHLYRKTLTDSGRQKPQYMHQFVWLLHFGRLPPAPLTIDHINLNKKDNRMVNLRPASRLLQMLNLPRRSRDIDLPRGVYRHKHWRRLSRPFFIKQGRQGSRGYCGYFATPEEASLAYESVLADRLASEQSKCWSMFQKGEQAWT